MNNLFRHIAIMSITSILFAACAQEISIPTDGEETSGDDCIQRVELSFQTDNFSTPITRSYLSENEIPNNLWVFVFRNVDGYTYFFEAAKINYDYVTAYVDLKRQPEACTLLIFAIPQDDFCLWNGMDFDPLSAINENQTKNDLNIRLENRSIEEVCNLLYTASLCPFQCDNPFSNKPLPMSCVYIVESINSRTKIEAAFKRAVAKIAVVNYDANFNFEGVVGIHNISRQGWLHNIHNRIPEYYTEKTDCFSEVDFLSTANWESTKEDPIYLYEVNGADDVFIIIKGLYNGIWGYYKINLDFYVERNNQYIFEISSVDGPGYHSYDEACCSDPFNKIQYEVTVTDASGFEIIANKDNYLAISNSVFIAYTDEEDNVELFNCVTNNFNDYININSNNYSVEIGSINPTYIYNSNCVTYLVNAIIRNSIKYSDSQGYIHINIGDLEKQILIRKKSLISAKGTTLIYAPEYDDESGEHMNYHCLSGYVSPTTDWIRLETANSTGNKVTADENGEIKIHIDYNDNKKRTGIVYLSVRVDDQYENKSIVKRIKLSITQNYILSISS